MSKINWLYLYLLKIKIHTTTEEGFCIFFKDYLYSLLVFSGSKFRGLPKEQALKLYTGSNANFDLSVRILIHKMRTVSVLVSVACHDTIHRLGDMNNRNSLPLSFSYWKSKIRVPVWLRFGEGSLPSLWIATILHFILDWTLIEHLKVKIVSKCNFIKTLEVHTCIGFK